MVKLAMNVCMHGVEIGPSKEGIISGGIPNSILRLSSGLLHIGINTLLVTNDRKYREISERTTGFTIPGLHIEYVLIKSNYATIKYGLEYLIKVILKIRRINNKMKLDIIHGHSGSSVLAIVTVLASKVTGVPAVHTTYCPVRKSKMSFLYKYFYRGLKNIIAVSNNIKTSMIEVGIPKEKITVIPPTIDYSVFRPGIGKGIREKLNIKADDFVILYLGNLTKTKGIDTVLDALAIVREQYHFIRLLLGIELSHTGTKIRKNEITEKINSCNLTQNVTELGLMPHVEKVMDTADIVVAPFQQTFTVADYPLTVLESMAVGNPVITTKVGGLPEFIENGKTGIFIDPNNPQDLASEIMKLIDNPRMRKDIGRQAASFVRKRFPTEDSVDAVRQIYNKARTTNE